MLFARNDNSFNFVFCKPTFRTRSVVGVEDGESVVGRQGGLAESCDKCVSGRHHSQVTAQVGVRLHALQDGLCSTLIRTDERLRTNCNLNWTIIYHNLLQIKKQMMGSVTKKDIY